MSEKTTAERLAEPFAPEEIKWLPRATSGNRALAMGYVNARAVMDRLDDVLGVAGWQDSYLFVENGNVVCTLRCLIDGQWISKSDVGGESEQKDGGDRAKAAVSDALKRTAVKFGIGRFLYSLPPQWCDYDVQKKQFVSTPKLPAGLYAPTMVTRGDKVVVRPPGALECLSVPEQHEVHRLLRESGAPLTAVLGWVSEETGMGIGRVEDVPRTFYERVLTRLKVTIAAKGK